MFFKIDFFDDFFEDFLDFPCEDFFFLIIFYELVLFYIGD